MDAIQFLSAQPWVERLGWTLVHFLWQGALIAAMYAAARRSRTVQFRYVLACIALAAMVMAPIVTFGLSGAHRTVRSNSPVPAVLHSSGAISTATPESLTSLPPISAPALQDHAMSWLVMAWFCGAIAFWARLTGGWIVAAHLRSTRVRPAPAEWQRVLDEIKMRIQVSSPVRLLISALVEVPTVVGWLRPVILVPIGALAGLPAEHIEALLAHELAHIRRHDYAVNILQSIAEALLFYHPAVWWISREIRHDRELCCDDIAVGISGNVLLYARALADLEVRRPRHFNPALAADGGSLSDRIARLLGQSRKPSRILPGTGILIGAILILITAYGLFGQAAAKPEFEVASVKPSVPGVMRGLAMRGGPGTNDPGRLTIENYPLESLILTAYDLKTYQLTGGPDWLMGNFGPFAARFDISAKILDATTKEQFHLMLQNLLVNRFKLALHREQREMPVYELVLAKNGPKFKPSPKDPAATDDVSPSASSKLTMGSDGFPVLPPSVSMAWVNDRARMRATKETMETFAGKLSVQMDRPVRNMTGLKGEYDFELFWLPDSVAAADMNAGPTLAQAVQDQLGLRLESKKGPVDVLVIDHIEKIPTEN